MGWMTIDWLSALICIRISFWPDTFSWRRATALTYQDIVCKPCSALWSAKLCSHAVFTCFPLIDFHCQGLLSSAAREGRKPGNDFEFKGQLWLWMRHLPRHALKISNHSLVMIQLRRQLNPPSYLRCHTQPSIESCWIELHFHHTYLNQCPLFTGWYGTTCHDPAVQVKFTKTK